MGFFLVLKAELVRSLIIMKRYWFRTLIGMILGYGMLIGLAGAFMSNRQVVTHTIQQQITDTQKNMNMDATGATNWALGFIIGMFAFGIVGLFTQGLQEMAASGQLEQLCMSPHGLITNFLARTFVGSVSSVITSSILIYAVAYTLGGQLHPDFWPTLVLLTLTFINLIGFGFMVGGLVLVFKQVGQVAMILRMVLFALAVWATDDIYTKYNVLIRWTAHVLPITDATICMKYVLISAQMRPVLDQSNQVMLDDKGAQLMQFVSVFQHPSFLFLLVSCIIWTLLGLICFRLMENWSRSKGTLGAY